MMPTNLNIGQTQILRRSSLRTASRCNGTLATEQARHSLQNLWKTIRLLRLHSSNCCSYALPTVVKQHPATVHIVLSHKVFNRFFNNSFMSLLIRRTLC